MNDELKIKNNKLGEKMNYRYRNDEEMKDSGVEWIGKIPKEWNITRVKYALRKKITDGPHETPQFISEGIPFLSVDAIQDGKLIFDNCRYISVEDHNRYIKKCKPEKNDVLMGKAASTGKIARIDKDIEFSIWSPLALLKPDTNIIKPKYLEYSMKSNQTQYEIELLCTNNTQKNISMDDIVDIKIIMPDIKKQKKIVDFLQQKTAQFDSIISKKEALIEKLEEAKKSLISEVVTGKVRVVKTDDGYKLVERKKEEMKYSGVEWLGLVPTEWKIYRSKYLWKKEKREVKEEYGVVTAFRDGEVTLRENRRTEGFTFAIKEIGYQGVLKGDLVISAMDAFAGAMGISDSEGKCSPVYSVCSPVKELEPQYYNYLLKEMSQKGYILSLAKGIRERSTDFRYSEFANTFLLYPNIEEQKIIANYLFEKIIFINNFIITINNQIEKLKEAKQSLISEAVTGKIEILD